MFYTLNNRLDIRIIFINKLENTKHGIKISILFKNLSKHIRNTGFTSGVNFNLLLNKYLADTENINGYGYENKTLFKWHN